MRQRGRALGPGKLRRVERPDGSVLWTLDYKDAKGCRCRQGLSAEKRVAERMRAELISQRDLQLAGLGTVEGQSRSLSELRDTYLADIEQRVGASQVRSVRDSLNRVFGALPAKSVRDVQISDVLRFRAARVKDGASNRTANINVNALRAMLNWAVSARLIAENPLRAVKPLPTDEEHQRRRRRALSDDEIATFLAAAEADDVDAAKHKAAERTIQFHGRGGHYASRRRLPRVPQRMLWHSLLETGARWTELTSVTWLDLDIEGCALTLRGATTKSGRTRVIPLLAETVDELVALKAIHQRARQRLAQPGDRIFLSPEGVDLPIATNAPRILFGRVLKRAGIDRKDAMGRSIDIHALRHTAATRMARNRVRLVVAQKMLGHASPDMTARVYTHLEVDDLREAVEFAAKSPRSVRGRAGAPVPGKLEQSA